MKLRSIAGAAALLLALGGVTNAQQIPLVIDNVDLVNPRLVNGVLTAPRGTLEGTLGGLPFTTDIKHFSLDLNPAHQQAGGCAILNLELAPIHIALLGLHVDTSRICLDITAFDTGLLGSLLCDLAGLNLNDLLDQLLGGGGLLGDILENVLGDVLSNGQPGQGQGGGNGNGNAGNGRVCRGQSEILHLVLGPLELNLLGLVVDLDNCHGGPVEVCVSATASEGLLGALLSGLTGPDLLGLNLADILDLAGLALDLLDQGLPLGDILDQVTDLLGDILGGVL